MAEEKSRGKFFVYCILILLLFLVMVEIIFTFGGKLIRAEILILIFLMFLALVGFSGYHKRWGERVLFFVFLISISNLVLVWGLTGYLYLLPMFLGVVGFLMGLPRREKETEEEEVSPYSEIFEIDEPEEKEVEFTEKKSKQVEFTPGKYVASKSGSVYHEPKCEWAKKIAENRRVWFKDKREAISKEYKPHSCVE